MYNLQVAPSCLLCVDTTLVHWFIPRVRNILENGQIQGLDYSSVRLQCVWHEIKWGKKMPFFFFDSLLIAALRTWGWKLLKILQTDNIYWFAVLGLYGTRFSYNDVNLSTTLNPSSTEQQVKDPLMQHQIFTEFNSQCAKILQTPTDQRWAH